VERLFRDARVLTFPDGTSEVRRLLFGRAALGSTRSAEGETCPRTMMVS
jgi:alkylation response protein AidB-like acyl-CoA dehydrogenase